MSVDASSRQHGVSSVLVGRRSELDRLLGALRAPSGIVVVEGEAGIGKSRLVAEAMATEPATTYFLGQCEMVQEPFLLGPVFDAIRRSAERLVVPQRLNPVTGALVPFLPEIADRLPPEPPRLADQAAERHRLYRGVTALLAAAGPAVLVLEDLHWAAPSTVEFIAFLAAHPSSTLRVVLTVRTENHDELAIWEALARSPLGPATRIPLQPLPAADVRRLAENILGGVALSESFVSSLSEKTAGIPFVVEEVLRTLTDEVPAAPYEADLLAGLAVPTALRDMLRQRLISLDERTQEILCGAAVLGMQPDEELLGRIVEHDAGTVARALGRGMRTGLLFESAGRCRFRHALVRQTVYEAAPAPLRRLLHLRAAHSLQAGPQPHPVARLAHHFRLGGKDSEFVRNAEAAADLAIGRGDDATAARFLLQALEVELPLGERIRLARRLGPVAVHGLAQSAAVPILQALLADRRVDTASRGDLRFLLGRLLRQQGDLRQAYYEIEQAIPDLVDSPASQALASAILAVPLVSGPTLADHRRHSANAQRLAIATGDPRVQIAVRIADCSLRLESGDPSGRSAAEALLAEPALLVRPREVGRASLNWAQEVLDLGDLQCAETLLAKGIGAIEQLEDLRLAAVIHLTAAEIELAAGRWSGLLERVRRIAAELGDFAAAQLDAQFLLGRLLARQGESAEAELMLREVIASAAARGAIRPLVPARAALARLLLDDGDAAGAVEQALLAIDQVRAKGIWVWGADSVLCLVDAQQSLGRLELARRLSDEFVGRLTGTGSPAAAATVLQWRAIFARAAGDHEMALGLLGNAVADLTRLGLAHERGLAVARLGEWQCSSGNVAGPANLAAALRSFGELGARRDIARICRVMRSNGVPVPSPWRGGRRSYGATLSPREREVSHRAAAGRSNQQIATELQLSTRTVESHVASALRKLGGRSRRELASLLTPTLPEPGEIVDAVAPPGPNSAANSMTGR
ncbi:ATP-binding protein [Nakamurella lactea]|uniref:ATP-binding protein n=1 Tax=Nakamurella lactea TaxID=459515 RepID=UPI0004906DAD|nr:LuxR family transcriptional regulator [Nakamurella lactea]